MADNDDYMTEKTVGDVISETMWDRLQEGINANRRYRLKAVVGGDDMEYDTTKVVWITDIYIFFTRESDGAWIYNKINANPTTGITCNANDVLYVTLNDTSGTVLTVSSADYSAMPTDDTGRILILGGVIGNTWYGNVLGGSVGWENPATESLDMGGYNFTNIGSGQFASDPAITFITDVDQQVLYKATQSSGSTANRMKIHMDVPAGTYSGTLDIALMVDGSTALQAGAVGDGAGGSTSRFVYIYDDLSMQTAHIRLPDNYNLYLGNGTDLNLYHDGSNSYIKNITNSLVIQSIGAGTNNIYLDTGDIIHIRDLDDSSASLLSLDTTLRTLYVGSSADPIKSDFVGDILFDTQTGTSRVYISRIGEEFGQSLSMYMDDNHFYFNMNQDEDSEHRVEWDSTDSAFPDQTVYRWNINGDEHFRITHDHIYTPKKMGVRVDGLALYAGAGEDIYMYHNGTHSFLTNQTGNLYLVANDAAAAIVNDLGGAFYIRDTDDSSADMFVLNTSSRTLVIGGASDPIASTHHGSVTVSAGSVLMDGSGTDDERLRVPYLTAIPSTVDNGSVWAESDGLHIYVGGAEVVLAAGGGGVDYTIDQAYVRTTNSAGNYSYTSSEDLHFWIQGDRDNNDEAQHAWFTAYQDGTARWLHMGVGEYGNDNNGFIASYGSTTEGLDIAIGTVFPGTMTDVMQLRTDYIYHLIPTRDYFTPIVNDTVTNQEFFLPAGEDYICYTSGTVNANSNIFFIAHTVVTGTSTSNIVRFSWDVPIPPGATSITAFYGYMRGNGAPAGNHKIHVDNPNRQVSSSYTPSWNIKNSTTSWSGDNFIKKTALWTGTWDLSSNHSGYNTVRIYWETTGTASNNVHLAGLFVQFT